MSLKNTWSFIARLLFFKNSFIKNSTDEKSSNLSNNQVNNQETLFHLPPYQVKKVFKASSETIDWGLKMLGIPEIWKITGGEGIRIAILDTGIDLQHPDLRDSIIEAVDFTRSPAGPSDLSGHGTHVAGIVAARENRFGVIGVAPKSGLLIAKVLSDNGIGSANSIVSAINWAIRERADIISMSLGSLVSLNSVHRAIKRAIKKKKFVVCAAGNSGPNLGTVNYPAAYLETISVGSIDREQKISNFSSRGKQVDIVAPGDRILSTYPPSGYAELSGTSMATPFVSGVIALALAKNRRHGTQAPISDQNELIKHLTKNSLDLGPSGFDPSYGFGLINPKTLISKNNDSIGTVNNLNLFSQQDFSSTGAEKLTNFLKNKDLSSPLSAELIDQNKIRAGEIRINF